MSSFKENFSPRILQIRRSDEDNAHVILHVSRSDPDAPEVIITATEGESPYTRTVQLSQLKKFKAKTFQGTDEEWKDIILHILGLLEDPDTKSEHLADIEASAGISGSGEDNKELVITVRKRIQTITQKLGSLTLHQDDEQGIELFEWSNIAITRAGILEQRFNSFIARFHTAENTINSLSKQLEELISSKIENEQRLMSDFAQLLNEKKLKIRNQQRLLAFANVDPEKLSEMQAATATDSSKPNAKGRRSKRAAGNIADESDSEDGFVKMDVDKSNQPINNWADEDTDEDGHATPQPIEDEDNTTSDDDEFAAPVSQREDKKKQGGPGQDASKSPPPRRELPFLRKSQGSAAAQSPRPQQDPDATDDDDEL
ncbi:hypothetical protein BDV12DRAFT_136483 [Aspergillus spectabilis]